jgi:hypothetical protein
VGFVRRGTRHLLAAVLLLGLLALIPSAAAAQTFAGKVTNYVDQRQQTALSFGDRSHWLQPWRAYLDTVPATKLRDAVGIHWNFEMIRSQDAPAIARLLGANGFRRVRYDIEWSRVDYDDPSRLTNIGELETVIGAFRDRGLRPLILLNGNHWFGAGPRKQLTVKLVEPASEEARSVHVDATTASQIVPRRSGLDLGPGAAPRPNVLFTSVDSNGVAALSKPLPRALASGDHAGSTLRYEPFGSPRMPDGSPNPRFEQTLRGWLDYVGVVTREVERIVGNEQFDVEIWNELSFGSDGLDIDNYYDPPIDNGQGEVTSEVLKRTVAWIRDPANGVSGVGIGNGFANLRPWDAGSTSPPGLSAIDKHPYLLSGMRNFAPSLAWQTVDETRPLDAQGDIDGTQNASGNWSERFTPTYDSWHPEYYLWATHKVQRYFGFPIQMDHLIRDLSPITTTIGDVEHGRTTHPPGAPAPGMWITEMMVDPSAVPTQFGVTASDRLHLQAKATLRTLTSFVNKGASAVQLYSVSDGNFGLVANSFFSSLASTGSYPGDTAGGEVMDSVRRLSATVSDATSISQPRQLSLIEIGDYKGNKQFDGDGTADHPPLYNRDVLAFLPFQVTDKKFVIPIYVMTTNLAKNYKPGAPSTDGARYDMPSETYRLTIGNLRARGAKFSATDPLAGTSVPVKVVSKASDRVVVEMAVTDSPRILTIRE